MLRRLLNLQGSGDLAGQERDAASAPTTAAERPSALPLVRVISSSGGALFADPASGELTHTPGGETGRGTPIVGLVVPGSGPDLAILFVCAAGRTLPLRAEGATEAASVLAFRIDPAAEAPDAACGLRDPRTGLALSAADFGTVPVPCNRREIGRWETFRLRPAEGETVPAPLAAAGRLLRTGQTARDLLDWLRAEDEASLAACGQAVLGVLPAGVLVEAAGLIETDRTCWHRLAAAQGGWLGAALRDLSTWLDARRPAARLAIDESLDILGRPAGAGGDVAGGLALLARLRDGVEPRGALAIVTVARNDGIHLLDWIAHHRALGVEHVFVYLQGSVDGSAALLSSLAEAGIVTLVEERHAPGLDGGAVHRKICTHALSCLPQTLDYRWTLVMDVDEYVVLDTSRHESLPALLAARAEGGAQAVALFRLFFRPGPAVEWTPEPVVSRFRRRYPHPFAHLKTVFLTGEHVSSNPHDPIARPGASIVTHDATGRAHHWPGRPASPAEGRPVFEDAWINIYMIRSIQEYLWQQAGARAVLPPGLSPGAVFGHVRSVVDEDLRLDERAVALVPAQQEELAALRALPGVAASERLVVDHFRRQSMALAQLVAQSMQSDPILRGVAATWLPRGAA